MASVFITSAKKGSEENERKELNICIERRSRTDSRVRRTWALIPETAVRVQFDSFRQRSCT